MAPWPYWRECAVGLDVGSRTVKLALFGSFGSKDGLQQLSCEDPRLGGTVHFFKWPSEDLAKVVEFIKSRGLHEVGRVVVTGHARQRHSDFLVEELRNVDFLEELGAVIRGVSWLADWPTEIYELVPGETGAPPTRKYLDPADASFPFLLVNMGTGVSIVKVWSHRDFQRVSGTAMGGGTYWGLCQLLTDCKTWEEAMELAASGNADDVNLKVRDIYGGDYNLPSGASLPGDLTASYFGKVHRDKRSEEQSLLAALSEMVSQNICQVAYLNARIHRTTKVIFTGNYLRQHKIAQTTIAKNFKRAQYSHANAGGQEMCACFLAHEGYFAALGSLLAESMLEKDTFVRQLTSVDGTDHLTDIEFRWLQTWQFDSSLDGLRLLEAVPEDLFQPPLPKIFSEDGKLASHSSPSLGLCNEDVIFRLSCAAAAQTFCSALVQTDVPALLMELLGQNPRRYVAFASQQASFEKVLDLSAVAVCCALSDCFGRKPLQMAAGGLFGVAWNTFCFLVPSPGPHGSKASKMAMVAALKLLHSASTSVFVAVNGSALSDMCQGSPEKVAAANAAAQSYVGLAVIVAPLAAVLLRRLHRRAPFAAAAALCALTWLQSRRLPETLPTAERTLKVGWAEALNPLASATLLLRQRGTPKLRALSLSYSLVSMTRCADTVLQAFTSKSMNWGRDESARLLSFWGATVFFGSQSLRKILKRMGPDVAVHMGSIFLAAQEFLKSLACSWWHLPAALLLGLPSAGLEPALKALIAQEARQSTALSAGVVQAALKTQQVLTLAVLGSPLIGSAFAQWATQSPTPRFAWHYLLCALAALAGGSVHAACREKES